MPEKSLYADTIKKRFRYRSRTLLMEKIHLHLTGDVRFRGSFTDRR
jgi:hypothetical protein